jgi:hypothetical protein
VGDALGKLIQNGALLWIDDVLAYAETLHELTQAGLKAYAYKFASIG